jgi:thiamine biosynthesis lipoprotein
VKLAEPRLSSTARQAMTDAIVGQLERVDTLMSTWRDDSELMRFNSTQSLEPFRVAKETAEVVSVALRVSALSGGALDITVGPLVEAWGFGRGTPPAPPDPATLIALRERVGWERLTLDSSAPALRKGIPTLELDLSAVAKGYAVDSIAAAVQEQGYQSFLVEVGGELRAEGQHLDGASWRVAIETPDVVGRAIHQVVSLEGRGMATSGDYRNYYEQGGKRFSHALDPRTGRPVEHGLASVTVLHATAADADAWATALQVLGPEAGYALAVDEELAAYFIVRRDDTFESRATAAFAPFLAEKELGR